MVGRTSTIPSRSHSRPKRSGPDLIEERLFDRRRDLFTGVCHAGGKQVGDPEPPLDPGKQQNAAV
jgi:hypothetical protein